MFFIGVMYSSPPTASDIFQQLLVRRVRFQGCNTRDCALRRAHLVGDILLREPQGIFQEIKIRQEGRQRLVCLDAQIQAFVVFLKRVHKIDDLILFHYINPCLTSSLYCFSFVKYGVFAIYLVNSFLNYYIFSRR